MIIRGAPAIGVAARTDVPWGTGNQTQDRNEFLIQLEEVAVVTTRPTAVNLFVGVRMLKTLMKLLQ